MSSQKIQESTPTSPPEKNPTREEFGRMFIARLSETDETEDLVFRMDDFSVGVVQPDGTVDEARTTRLENTYREYLVAPPEKREEVVAVITNLRRERR